MAIVTTFSLIEDDSERLIVLRGEDYVCLDFSLVSSLMLVVLIFILF